MPTRSGTQAGDVPAGRAGTCRAPLAIRTAALAAAFWLPVASTGAALSAEKAEPGSSASATAALKDAAEKASMMVEGLRGISAGLKRASEEVAGLKLPDEEKKELCTRIAGAQRLVGDSLVAAGGLRDSIQGAGNVLDLCGQIRDIRATVRALDIGGGGKLSAALTGLSTLLEKYGGKVPLIGKALEVYGKTTKGLLGAIAKVADEIEENRRQGHVGCGTSHLRPHRNHVLWKQDQKTFEASTYAPCGPSYAYRPIDGNEKRMVLLWDALADKWHIIKREVSVEDVYADNLLLGVQLRPAGMLSRLQNPAYEEYLKNRRAGEEIAGYLQRLSESAIDWAVALSKSDLPYFNTRLFRAQFACEPPRRSRVWRLFKSFFDGYVKGGRADLAERLRQRAVGWGCEEARQWKAQVAAGPSWKQKVQLDVAWFGKRPHDCTQPVRLYAWIEVEIKRSGEVTARVIETTVQNTSSYRHRSKFTSGGVKVEIASVKRTGFWCVVSTKCTFTVAGKVLHADGEVVDSGKTVKEKTYNFEFRCSHQSALAQIKKFTYGPAHSREATPPAEKK